MDNLLREFIGLTGPNYDLGLGFVDEGAATYTAKDVLNFVQNEDTNAAEEKARAAGLGSFSLPDFQGLPVPLLRAHLEAYEASLTGQSDKAERGPDSESAEDEEEIFWREGYFASVHGAMFKVFAKQYADLVNANKVSQLFL
eukprot:COSAG02_NODE_4277_length_5558_cov_8.385968_3_plen_142_part_00